MTGTAPFHLVLSGRLSGSGYQMLVQRTDSTAGCAAWPQSGFGGSYGAEVSLPADNLAKCLTIPAGQHSTGEMIDYENLTGQADAAVYVNDPAGNQICVGSFGGLLLRRRCHLHRTAARGRRRGHVQAGAA